jgi:hypothetical protein
MPKSKIDLTVLKRMVEELEASLGRADEIRAKPTAENRVDWIVELNKATGLAAGVLTEAGLLMGDIQHLVAGVAGGGADSAKQDFIKQLLGGLKGPGTSN